MIVNISSDAEEDLAQGYWFYERQSEGLGDYFRASISADIESLAFFGGIHQQEYGHHRMLAKTFPFVVYYDVAGETVTIFAVLDARRDPSWTRDRLQ